MEQDKSLARGPECPFSPNIRKEIGTVNRQSVSSSNLRSVGYDDATQTLEIAFHDGGVYQYYDVPKSVYQGLLVAGSKGSYHHTHIKDRYRYRKVG